VPAADDDELQARLEALEAEVKAESDAKRAVKAQAEARVKAQRAKQQAERDELRERQAAIVKAKSGNRTRDRDRGDRAGDLETALDLAKKANDAKHELTKPREAGEKSWLISGALSFFLGPLGWLYAGAWRESIPAALGYLLVLGLVTSIVPMFLLMPVMMVALPLSGVAGVVYAIGHNRNGSRIRLFGDDDDKGDDPRIGKLGSGKSDE
jgi:predicted phage gp36 major capsid-like protein